MTNPIRFQVYRKTIRGALGLMLIAIVPALLAWSFRTETAIPLLPDEITIDDQRVTEHVVWVDARSPEQYTKEHVTGAILLNEKEWDTLLRGLFEAWQPGRAIIVYCDPTCGESQKVAARLREMGMEPAYFLKGGYEAWKKSQIQ